MFKPNNLTINTGAKSGEITGSVPGSTSIFFTETTVIPTTIYLSVLQKDSGSGAGSQESELLLSKLEDLRSGPYPSNDAIVKIAMTEVSLLGEDGKTNQNNTVDLSYGVAWEVVPEKWISNDLDFLDGLLD